MRKIILSFICVLCLSISAASWKDLYKVSSIGKKVIVSYDPVEKIVKLQYRKGLFGSLNVQEYSVSNSVLIDEALADIELRLKSKNFSKEIIEDAIDETTNLKYLNGSSCHIVNFGVATPESAKVLDPLIEEITSKLKEQNEGVESHYLLQIKLEGIGAVELRAVTDDEDKIIQFSLYSNSKDLSHLKIEKDGDYYHVTDKEKHVFTLNVSGEDRERLSILSPTKNNVQNIERVHIKLEKVKNEYVANSFSNNKKIKSQRKKYVDLTKGSADHEGVSRVADTNRFYKSIHADELNPFLNGMVISKELNSLVNESFIKCMDEHYLLSLENNEKDFETKMRPSCIKESMVEGFFSKINRSQKLFSSPIDKAFLSIKEQYLTCLLSKKVFTKKQDMRIFNHPISSSEESVSKCLSISLDSMEKEYLKRSFQDNDEIKSLVSERYLLTTIENELSRKFDSCLKSSKSSRTECRNHVEELASYESLKAILVSKVIKAKKGEKFAGEILSLIVECDKSNKKTCLKSAFVKIENSSLDYHLDNLMKSVFPDDKVSLSKLQTKDFKSRYSVCIEGVGIEDQSLLEAYQLMTDKSYECEVRSLAKVLPVTLVARVLKSEPYSMLPESKKEAFEAVALRYLKKKLRRITSINDIKEVVVGAKRDLLPPFVDFYIGQRLDDTKTSNSARTKVYKDILLSISGDSKLSLKANIDKVLNVQEHKRSDFNTTVFINNTLRNFEVSLYSENHEEAETAEYKDCMKRYSPAWKKISLSTYVGKCERVLLVSKFFKDKKKVLESLVSANFPLSSNEANNALAPVFYLEECLKEQPIYSSDAAKFQKKLDACYLVAKLDVSINLSELKIEQNQKVITSVGGVDVEVVSRYCYNSFFLFMAGDVGKSNLSKVLKDQFKGALGDPGKTDGLIEMLQKSHRRSGTGSILEHLETYVGTRSTRRKINTLLEIVSKVDKFDEEYFDKHLNKCNENVDSMIYSGLRGFILKNIPASFSLDQNSKGETNRDILRRVFDEDLLKEILSLTHKRPNSVTNNSSTKPSELVVTGELSVETLANLIKLIGKYISKGLFFDQDKMKTELVVFRSELKRALKWLNTTDKAVTLSDLQDFFKSTKLADILAYATVAENVSDRFSNFIYTQELSEKAKLRKKFGYKSRSKQSRSQRKEWDRMIEKFSKMRKEVKEMTTSYDFRRLFRDGSEKTRIKLDKIKENYLLPLITKGRATEKSKQEVMAIVADLILKDNAKGGFAERFTGTVAGEFLKNDEDSHWAITKYFFYDDKDFDWQALKKTKSGAKAIDYYSENILLPKILGQRVSNYTKVSRLSYFKKLLKKAQNENDD
ncbi:hypothetical protein A9Q84_07845 [Halobacteriovorax marinus]|uniref:Uncharacterized protein n=1 Tax=Halobacteriovorax marinus TaxID=97084 RepID=A0A1Y5F9S9_9BACT|nr:hypothetical protein A9Q84_07845 [Halobacteriovorax marinus]